MVQSPADAPAHVHLRDREEGQRRRDEAAAQVAAQHFCQHHAAQSLGAAHFSPRQRLIYVKRGGIGLMHPSKSGYPSGRAAPPLLSFDARGRCKFWAIAKSYTGQGATADSPVTCV